MATDSSDATKDATDVFATCGGLGKDSPFRTRLNSRRGAFWNVDMSMVDLLRLCSLAWNSFYFLARHDLNHHPILADWHTRQKSIGLGARIQPPPPIRISPQHHQAGFEAFLFFFGGCRFLKMQ
jgi:hypothetical protein